MQGKWWGGLAVVVLVAGLVSACDRQEVVTAPPVERTAPVPEERPPAVTEAPAQADDEFMGQAPAHGPETVVLTAKNGDITFSHARHAEMVECRICHGEGAPGAIDLDRDSGHQLCRGCHEEQGAGPVKCAECHARQ
jgi:predicted CXXCH cytochrome family protein